MAADLGFSAASGLFGMVTVEDLKNEINRQGRKGHLRSRLDGCLEKKRHME